MGEGLGVVVIGAWCVGLVTAACLAFIGHRAACVEKNRKRLRGLTKARRMPVYEPGLEELVWRGVRAETLRPRGNISWSC